MKKIIIVSLRTKAIAAALTILTVLNFNTTLYAEEAQGIVKHTIKKEYSSVEVDIEYPFMTGNTQSSSVFNQLVEDITVKIWPQYYQSSLPENERKPIWEMELCGDDEEKCNLRYSLDYEVFYADDNYVSIEFKQYWYQGGLHGSYVTFGLNYNMQDSEEIKLHHLFQEDSLYLDKLAELSNQGLKDIDCVNQDVTPKDYLFENWMINQVGLEIVFPIYSVAPYTCGEQTVFIPFSSLQETLSESFVRLIKHEQIN